jgi:hypothetical protein
VIYGRKSGAVAIEDFREWCEIDRRARRSPSWQMPNEISAALWARATPRQQKNKFVFKTNEMENKNSSVV